MKRQASFERMLGRGKQANPAQQEAGDVTEKVPETGNGPAVEVESQPKPGGDSVSEPAARKFSFSRGQKSSAGTPATAVDSVGERTPDVKVVKITAPEPTDVVVAALSSSSLFFAVEAATARVDEAATATDDGPMNGSGHASDVTGGGAAACTPPSASSAPSGSAPI
eukprot:6286817-Prymnesium_polylepis.1